MTKVIDFQTDPSKYRHWRVESDKDTHALIALNVLFQLFYRSSWALPDMGFEIDDSSINDLQNLKRLMREKNGSVVALPTLVDWANQQAEFAGQIRLIEKPLKSKSYFLAFSKAGHVNTGQAMNIWQQIIIARKKNQFKEYVPKAE